MGKAATKTARDQANLVNAIADLSGDHRGRSTLRGLIRLLRDDGADGLDEAGQEALATLLAAAYGPFRGSVVDMMRDAVGHRNR